MPRLTITVPGQNAQPYRFQLDRQSVTLGRASDNDIAIDCGSISLKHAEMCRVVGGYILRDTGSTNGIKLNDERSEEIPLHNGISVTLGNVAFEFQLSDEERDALAQEKPAMDSPHPREAEAASSASLPSLKERSPRSLPVQQDNGLSGFSLFLLLVLATLMFGAGMAVRFHKETGGSLIDVIKAKLQYVPPSPRLTETPDTTAPDTTAPDATTPDATTPDTPAPDADTPQQ